MEDRDWLPGEVSARLKPWARALREDHAPDEAALRASLMSQG